MPNTYTKITTHIVFTTKNRAPHLTNEICKRLYPYIGAIAKKKGFPILSIGGINDHIHILLSQNKNYTLAESVKFIKACSSKWIHLTFPDLSNFNWQEGYGAFSVSQSNIRKTIEYINNQDEHHRKMTFKQEYLKFLDVNGIEYDDRFVF